MCCCLSLVTWGSVWPVVTTSSHSSSGVCSTLPGSLPNSSSQHPGTHAIVLAQGIFPSYAALNCVFLPSWCLCFFFFQSLNIKSHRKVPPLVDQLFPRFGTSFLVFLCSSEGTPTPLYRSFWVSTLQWMARVVGNDGRFDLPVFAIDRSLIWLTQ